MEPGWSRIRGRLPAGEANNQAWALYDCSKETVADEHANEDRRPFIIKVSKTDAKL
jgi:hypothetical protein